MTTPSSFPTFNPENTTFPGCNHIMGIDEAGRGPWAGPVVAGAVIFIDRNLPKDLASIIQDSKKLSRKKREIAYGLLEKYQGSHLYIGMGIANVEEIDSLNILQATFLAMSRAYESIKLKPEGVLIDGNKSPKIPCKSYPIIKGDQHSFSIAAASIVAKVTRDRLMDDLHKDYPVYGWNVNAGYGTKIHQEALALHGITPHHRKSFKPISQIA